MKNKRYISQAGRLRTIINMAATVSLIVLISMPFGAQAQSYMYQKPTLTTENDVCDQGVGSATVHLSVGMAEECDITWDYGTGVLSNLGVYNQHASGITTLPNLSSGTKGKVTVKIKGCNLKIFQKTFSIREDECKLDVVIGEPSISGGGCNSTPSATFTATVSGGTPPYSSSWGSPVSTNPYTFRTTVSSTGKNVVKITVTDSEGKKGAAAAAPVFLEREECSQDPNEIKGPDGYDDSVHFVAANQRMNYSISFENDPDFAMAPATRVYVTYPVPPQQNISSFRLADFGFGNYIFTVPSGLSSYTKRLDVSDSLGVMVDVTAGIDIVNNQLFWIFQSIDPSTGFEPASAQMGFLPINDSLGSGEGYVSFYIMPQNGLHTGDTVAAQATIVFDDNAPIETNVWNNTFDAVAPTSSLHCILDASDSLSCTISFDATDDDGGSGVANVGLFVSVNESEYSLCDYYHPDSNAYLSLEQGKFYKFISQAVDNVGNTEAFKSEPDTTVNYNTAPVDILLSNEYFHENDSLGMFIAQMFTLDDDVDQPFVYELVNGAGSSDNGLFRIEGDKLLLNSSVACIDKYEFTVRIRTTDVTGLSYEDVFILSSIQENYHKTDSLDIQMCQGEKYFFDSQWIGMSGIYIDTLHTYKGCDSIVTLNLKVNPVYAINETFVVCDSMVWQNNLYVTSNDSASITYRTVAGCDSTLNLDLTVNHSSSGMEEVNVCDNFTWHGNTFTESTANVVFDTLNSFGCDSVAVLNLTIRQSSSHIDNQTACDSYTWQGITYTESTCSPSVINTNVVGCDSTTVLHLTLKHSSEAVFTHTACDSYTWIDDNTYTTSNNTASFVGTNTVGCDSIITLNLTVNYSNSGIELQNVCDSYTWIDGNTYTASNNTSTYTVVNQYGCDSIVTLNLTVRESSTATEVHDVCDSFTWHGTTYTTSTSSPTFIETNAAGCDSVTTLNLTVRYSSAFIDAHTVCDSIVWQGTTYIVSTNTPTYSLLNAVGCDSVVTLNLTVNYSTTGIETVTACDSYTWNGTEYTADNNMATYMTSNAVGCDSVVTLNLTINNSTNVTENVSACDNYTWNGMTLTESGSYVWPQAGVTSLNAAGCDSVVTLNLIVNNSTNTIETVAVCDSYIWHGTEYTASNYTATFTETNAAGCDSIVALNLTVNYSNTGIETVTACNSYIWHGTEYNASNNTATYTATNVAGCDSVITLNLTINHCSTTELVACDSYTWHGTTYYTSGTYTVGSDTLFLTVNYSSTGSETVTSCDSYTWHGTEYTASNNTATFATINASGCDSVVALNLTVNYSNTGIETVTACNSYIWHGTEYNTSNNTATYTATNAVGCDSVITLNLTINHCSTTELVACDSYTWQGTTYYTSGTYTVGSDTLFLTVNYSNTGIETVTSCDSYTWHGTEYTASSNTATFTEINAAGCDSVVTLNLTVNYSDTSVETVTACDSYTWHGTEYTASNNTATFTITNADGCDSVITLNLIINYSTDTTDTVIACNSYEWHGTVYTASTDEPIYTTSNAVGCDSVVILNLIINQCSTTELTACDSLAWHDMVYTTSGTYVDGFDTLQLTVNYSSYSSEIDTTCDSYTWNDSTYTISGLYTYQTTNIEGCDSTVTLNLTVNYSTETFDSVIVSSTELPYIYNGINIENGGDYDFVLTTNDGCDSIVYLHLTVNQVGIEMNDDKDGIRLYPNPTTGKVTVEADGVVRIDVLDIVGRQVASFEKTDTIDISNLETGSYTLRIVFNKGITIRKVVKK